jgi:hypothetical protein
MQLIDLGAIAPEPITSMLTPNNKPLINLSLIIGLRCYKLIILSFHGGRLGGSCPGSPGFSIYW